MTVSNEKFDYILKKNRRVWKHSFNMVVTSQLNLIERIFADIHEYIQNAYYIIQFFMAYIS